MSNAIEYLTKLWEPTHTFLLQIVSTSLHPLFQVSTSYSIHRLFDYYRSTMLIHTKWWWNDSSMHHLTIYFPIIMPMWATESCFLRMFVRVFWLLWVPFSRIWIVSFHFNIHFFLQFWNHFSIPSSITTLHLSHAPLSLPSTTFWGLCYTPNGRNAWKVEVHDWGLLIPISLPQELPFPF